MAECRRWPIQNPQTAQPQSKIKWESTIQNNENGKGRNKGRTEPRPIAFSSAYFDRKKRIERCWDSIEINDTSDSSRFPFFVFLLSHSACKSTGWNTVCILKDDENQKRREGSDRWNGRLACCVSVSYHYFFFILFYFFLSVFLENIIWSKRINRIPSRKCSAKGLAATAAENLKKSTEKIRRKKERNKKRNKKMEGMK